MRVTFATGISMQRGGGGRAGTDDSVAEATSASLAQKAQNPKCDESGSGRDESGKSRDESATAGTNRRRVCPPPQLSHEHWYRNREGVSGVLLLSPPGCGKSQFAKALGNETGRPTVVLDVGALLGSLVGQSESNVRAALKLADAMAPCVLFADEIEKALAGATSSGQTDSGATARVFGSLLTWLNDHESDVFFVGTCNDASKLPPEFARAERFDGVFFVDLPGRDQKDAIWGIYTKSYGLDAKQTRPDDTNWTGAEIKSCCRLASLLDVPLVQAAQNVVPVAVTAGDKIEGLRQWASGRCLSADRAGVYSRSDGVSGGRVRRVVRAE